jgi:hypothetical protein
VKCTHLVPEPARRRRINLVAGSKKSLEIEPLTRRKNLGMTDSLRDPSNNHGVMNAARWENGPPVGSFLLKENNGP